MLERGLYFHRQGNFLQAQEVYEGVLKMHPNNFDALQLLGSVFAQTDRFHQAIELFEKALIIRPNNAICLNGLANSLQKINHFDSALAAYDRAVELQPNYAEAWFNRGNLLKQNNLLGEAALSYKMAISLKPHYTDAHLNLSLCYLLDGEFENGWLEYEWRWRHQASSKLAGARQFPRAPWLGNQSLKDRVILLYSEQGLGDTIQFSRYVSLVAQLGPKVILEVQEPLLRLFDGLQDCCEVFAAGEGPSNFDYQCPLMSLPLAFKTTLEKIPNPTTSILIDEYKVSYWQNQLGFRDRLRVGIAWSGKDVLINGNHRSVALSELLPYLPINYDYICLQKEILSTDQKTLDGNRIIRYFGDQIQDFSDTAALCSLVDVVVSIDTSVAHLAGTLGIPTHLLLLHNPDWRWLLNRDDSPWYPSMKLYRQAALDDWASVFKRIQAELLGMDRLNCI